MTLRFRPGILLVALAAFVFSGCYPVTMKGKVEEDVSLTRQTLELEEAGFDYRGPQYNVAIITFENKTPGQVLGVGNAATDIMRTIVKKAGLEPIVLTEQELRDQERLIELQQTGALQEGKRSTTAGFESVDFRISGAVTHYSEVEEEMEIILAHTKTRIARVQVDYAIVDVQTGKSLVAESGMGEYRKKTGGLLGLGTRSTPDPSLRDGALRDALTKAMTKMVEKLNAEPFQSRILAIEGPMIIIRAGMKSNLAPGTVFAVYRSGRDIIDPETGRAVGTLQQKIGEIVLTTHQGARLSEASARSGAGFAAGDIIKTVE